MLPPLLLVGLGGMLGSMLRYLVGQWLRSAALPYGTLVVNLSGSLLIGFLMAKYGRQLMGEDWRIFLVAGFCGGFTTLSALSWESLQFIQQGKYGIFVGYALITVLGGLLMAALGYNIAK